MKNIGNILVVGGSIYFHGLVLNMEFLKNETL